MGKSQHKGKVIIGMDTKVTCDIPKYFTTGTHIITGGLGGFGLELAKWLGERGATSVILTSRSGIRNGWQKRYVDQMELNGMEVIISKLDIRDIKQTNELLKLKNNVKGIWHLAMVLRDTTLNNMTDKDWEISVGTKSAIINLHNGCTKLNLDLQTFCSFSSVSNRFGNVGQTNYAWGNSVGEQICKKRVQSKLPGLAIQWGIIGDVGVAATDDNAIVTMNLGMEAQPIDSCFQYLNNMLCYGGTNENNCIITCYQNATPIKTTKTSTKSLLESILDVLGVQIDDVTDKTTLVALGIDSLQSVLV
eukprot:UN30368